MKLRLRGNSIRLRLTATEVRTLDTKGFLEEHTHLTPDGESFFGYRIEAAPHGQSSVRLIPGGGPVMVAAFPKEQIAAWASNAAQVGLYSEEAWGLKVAVEKDFKCLDPRRDEDESDNYENPNQGKSLHTECHADD